MRIALVTAFPPSHERINEYGYHLANELQQNPLLSVTVLADHYTGPEPEIAEFDVVRCWRPDSLRTPFRLLKAIRRAKPDVVWFNLVFSSFGGVNPFAAFLGLCVPMIARLLGYSTHVTLHHLMETLDLAGAGIKHPTLYRIGGWLATKVLLRANSVTVLLPDYRRMLTKKYRGKHVHLRPHGIFTSNPQPPDLSARGNPHRILAFGKWGTYKKVEILLEAFDGIAAKVPGCRLVIAGENHPNAPGYVEGLRARYGHRDDIDFIGYIAEEDIPELFRTASVMVMPYTSAGGPSGVAHQAAQFGVPIVSADIHDFRDMAAQEGFAMEFFRKSDAASLANTLVALLNNPAKLREMAEQNFSAAVRVTMPSVIRQYVRSFDRYHTARTMQALNRFARLPRWTRTRPVRAFSYGMTLMPDALAVAKAVRPKPAMLVDNVVSMPAALPVELYNDEEERAA